MIQNEFSGGRSLPYKSRKVSLVMICRLCYCAYFALFYLYYISFVPSVLSSLLLATTAALGVLVIFMGNRLYFSGYEKRYLCFIGAVLLSFAANGFSSGLSLYASNLIVCVLMSMILCTILRDERNLIVLQKCVVWSALITVVYLYTSGQLRNVNHLSVTFADSINALALTYLIPFSFSVYLVFTEKTKVRRLIYIAISIITFIFIAISGSRTALIASVTYITVFVFSKGTKKSTVTLLKRVIIAAVGLVILYFIVWKIPVIYQAIGFRIDGLIDELRGNGTEFSANRRLNLIDMGWEAYLRKPLLGYGVEGFSKSTGLSYYSHNTYIETLSNYGIVGFLAYYSIAIGAIWRIRAKMKADGHTPLLCFMLASIIMVLISEIGTVGYDVWVSQSVYALAYVVTSTKAFKTQVGSNI